MRICRLLVPTLFVLASGCDRQTGVLEPPGSDQSPPSQITNLSVAARSDSTLMLTWTAPENDGASGGAARYLLRMASTPPQEGTWSGSSIVNGPYTPKSAGAPETLVVRKLLPATRHYFALQAVDPDSNWLAVSNVASGVTSGLLQVVTAASFLDRPAWSPDGSRIAYTLGAIYIVNSDGTGRVRVFDQEVWHLSWSPDGTMFTCILGEVAEGPVALLPAEGGTPELVDLPAVFWAPRYPAWSPAGTEIAVVVGDWSRGIAVLPVAGGETHGIASAREIAAPAWSPDGSMMAYAAVVDHAGEWGLWTHPTNGGQAKQLYSGDVFSPSYSADGEWIAFVAVRGDISEIRLVPAGGGTSIPLHLPDEPDARNPQRLAWSPDGTRIAFVSQSGRLWVYSLDPVGPQQ